jgi:L-ascorbate metabolism protein UlaG (beta-lactamase superfamily)
MNIRWLGHATFELQADGTTVLVDPWLTGNPKCPESEQTPERVDVIAITHAHGDHLGDTVDLAKQHGCTVIAPVELADWLQMKHQLENVRDPNKGGTVDVDGIRFTLTDANHSSSNNDLEYMGEPCGIVVRADGKSIYFAGDTNVFGDMGTVIARLYAPDVAVLPIGDHYTMGPDEAALAVELLGVKRVVPCHWGTFPALTGTPDALAEKVGAGVTVERIEPGDTVTI